MKLFRNLTSYEDKGLENIKVNGRHYLGISGYLPSCFVGLAFGRQDTPCTMNLGIAVDSAQIVFGKYQVITQQAILDTSALVGRLESHPDTYFSIDATALETVKYSDRQAGHGNPLEASLNSCEALEIARGMIDDQKLDPHNVLFFAHPAHMERVLRTAEKFDLAGQPFVEKHVTWNPEELGDNTISAKKWGRYEFLVRIHHKLTGTM